MHIRLAIAVLGVVCQLPVAAAPAAVATCTVVYIAVGKPYGTYDSTIKVPCAVTTPNSVTFDDGGATPNGNAVQARSWTANLPANETGSVYLTADEQRTDYRSLMRKIKPYIGSAAYFGTLFSESLGSYRQAAINRNESAQVNLGRVRDAATHTQSELAQASAARYAGLPTVATQQATRMAQNLSAGKAKAALGDRTAKDIAATLAKLPQPVPPTDLSLLAGRDKLPQAIVRQVSNVMDQRRMVGSVSLASQGRSDIGLANAVDLELGQYERMDPSVRTTARAKQGAEALKQAKFFASRSPEVARALYAEGRSTRAFLAGQSKKDEVAVWDDASRRITFAPRADAFNRVLAYATLFGDQSADIRGKAAAAAGGATQRPPDSVLRTTEEIVSRAEDDLDSDPVKSLGGLFRARTLIENVQLYGGAMVKLTKWTTGAAKRLKDVFAPPKTITEPGGFGKYVAIEVSKKLKESMTNYRNAIEAGEYAVLGIDKVHDIFGSEALAEMKNSLRDATVAAAAEAQPMTELDKIAPTVDLWVSEDARAANANNTKAEIAELTKLRDLYSNRAEVLKIYQERLGALSALSSTYAIELSSPVWATVASMNCLSTVCAAEVLALSEQLVEVGALANDAGREARTTIQRYQSEIHKIDQLLDAWMLVLPGGGVKGYRAFGAPARELTKQFP